MTTTSLQDQHYLTAVEQHGPSLCRLVRASEANVTRQQDLLQEIHVALWRSFARFEGSCSMATWVYRVAHNATASYVSKEQRHHATPMGTEEIDQIPDTHSVTELAEERDALKQLTAWLRRLKHTDRQVMVLYLEELSAKDIAEISGLTAAAVATRISRLKTQLTRDFSETHDD